MKKIVLNYTTDILTGDANGQAFEIPGYTEESILEVYLNSVKLSDTEYTLSINKDCIMIDTIGTPGYTGTEKLPLEIHIINSDVGETEEDVSIYVPNDYSAAADIIADLKKMAESIKIFVNKTIEKNGGGTTDYNELENKPDLSGFITNAVDDLLNYYTKSESCTKEEVITTINNRIDELVAGAPETFDTLKEIADYIAEHADVTQALNEAIGNKASKEEIAGLATKTYVDNKIGDIDALLSTIADESEAI